MTPIFSLYSSSWVKTRLDTENQLPRSSGSALKVCVVGWWGGGGVGWWVPLDYVVTPTSSWVEVGL